MSETEVLYHGMDLDMVQRFVDEQRVEELHLDFKGPLDFKKRDSRKEFAIAVTGFANSDGGVIVWGVDARKQKQGEPDAACGLKPCERLKAFMSDLQTYTGRAANPTIDGVVHKEVPIPGEVDKGYAATLVPASDSTPHMAKLGEDRYYKRSGDSFYRMEHFDLEDMFGRRPRPKLDLYTDIRLGARRESAGRKSCECVVVLGIVNKGRGIGRAPYILIRIDGHYRGDVSSGLHGHGRCGLPELRPVGRQAPGEKRFGGDANIVLHTGIPLEVTTVRREVSEETWELPDLRVEFEISAWGARPVQGTRVIRGPEIANKVEDFLI